MEKDKRHYRVSGFDSEVALGLMCVNAFTGLPEIVEYFPRQEYTVTLIDPAKENLFEAFRV